MTGMKNQARIGYEQLLFPLVVESILVSVRFAIGPSLLGRWPAAKAINILAGIEALGLERT